jgi:hypothetical protein
MKKILFIMALTAFGFVANAQLITFSHTATNPNGTVTNTGTDTMNASIPGYAAALGIQLAVTKTSGTVAGIARLYGSIDGTNYIATGDTLTLTDVATNSVIWTKSTPVYVNYRIRTTGSGTMVATTSAKAVQRKP